MPAVYSKSTLLNDLSPYLNSENDGRRIHQKPPNQADLLHPSSELAIEDACEIDETLNTDTIALEAFTAIESKFTAVHEDVAKQTESVDARKSQLIVQLTSLNSRIQPTRALLLPSTSPRKYSNGEVLSLASVASSSRFL
jgi:hypothetical protein